MNATDAMEETKNSILEANIIIKRNLANFPFAMFLHFERIWVFFVFTFVTINNAQPKNITCQIRSFKNGRENICLYIVGR